MAVQQIFGSETGGNEETASTTGSPNFNETTVVAPGGGTRSVLLAGAATAAQFTIARNTQAITQRHIVGFKIRLTDLTPTNDVDVFLNDSTAPEFRLRIEGTSGDLILVDANNVEQETTSGSPFTVDTWHRVEVGFLKDTVGNATVFIDGSQTLDDASGDYRSVGAAAEFQFSGTDTASEDIYIDDFYALDNVSANSDRYDDWAVIGYQNDQGASQTPDGGLVTVGTSGGDNAANNWDRCAETPGDTTVATSYTASGAAGSVDLTGPSGDADIDGDSNIKAIKGVWTLSRGNGGGTTHYIGLGDSGDTDVADQTVSLNTSFAVFEILRETNLPTASQFIRQGFGTNGARDINCGDMWAMLLHVPTPPAGGDTYPGWYQSRGGFW